MKLNLTFSLILTIIFLTSCNSSKSVRLKDTSATKNIDISNLPTFEKVDNASIVHIDKEQRVITIRCTSKLEDGGYYKTYQELSDKQNSLIKMYESSYESIYIADILEGMPRINDLISTVSKEKSLELDSYYTDADID